MKFAVTGAAGFVGYNLVKTLLRGGHSVACIDALIDTTYSAETKKIRWQELQGLDGTEMFHVDLRFDDLYLPLLDRDILIHAAAIPGLSLSWENFELYASCNLTATQRLVRAVIETNPKMKFIHISTSSVYGSTAISDENSTLNPVSPYGVTKLAAEKILQAYSANYELNFAILRYFSIYGPGQRPDMAYSKFIESIDQGRAISVFGDGLQTRTNTFISDCVDATINLSLKEPMNEIYNLSGTSKINVLEVIEILEGLLQKKAVIEFKPPRPGDQIATYGNIQRITDYVGYQPKVNIIQGLKLQVESYLNDK